MAWPTTSDPKTEFITLRLTLTEAQALDDAARAKGLSRSAYLRNAVERCTTADAKRASRAQRASGQGESS